MLYFTSCTVLRQSTMKNTKLTFRAAQHFHKLLDRPVLYCTVPVLVFWDACVLHVLSAFSDVHLLISV